MIDYLHQKGWVFKFSGKEILVEVCPYCRDSKYHFWINQETGQWKCFKCGEGGGVFKLKKDMGDLHSLTTFDKRDTKEILPPADLALKHHHNISKKAISYLAERLITEDTIKRFKLGSVIEDGIEYITIPHYSGEKLINIKKRSIPPAEKAFKRETGCQTILFNRDALRDFKEVIVTEGEIDALTLLQEGINNVVGLTGGAQSFPPQFYNDLKDKEKIYICMDEGDKNNEGQKGANEIARRLGRNKCRNILIPQGAHDINNMKMVMKEDFKIAFLELKAEAKEFRIPNILTLQEILERGEDEIGEALTPWENINKLIGGVEDGYVIAISALSKQGKSAWAENILHYQVVSKGQASLYYCVEMSPVKIFHRFCTIHYGRAGITRQEKEGVKDYNFIVGFNETRLTPEVVFETIREAVGRYGIKFVVFDHIHFLFRDTDIDEKIGTFMRDAKLIATELGIKFIVIAQPKKIENINRMLNSQDLKYGGSIFSDADILILLQRKRLEAKEGEETETALSRRTLVRVEGSRYSAGGQALLSFDGKTMKFEVLEKKAENDK